MVLLAVGMTSCVDHEVEKIEVNKPESLILQEEIDSYAALKSYIDREKNPDFKLGAGASLSDYISKGVTYRLLNRNFDEITLGYKMKHGAVILDDGTFLTGEVEDLLKDAEAAGMTVFGHTLAWHANQNAKYLNSRIAPVLNPGAGDGVPTWDVVASADFETDSEPSYEYNDNGIVSFTGEGEGANGIGRALRIENHSVRTNDYDVQLYFKFSPGVQAGETYTLSMDIRADQEVTFTTQAQTAVGAYKHYDFFGSPTATTEWTTYTKEVNIQPAMEGSVVIAFNLGATAADYYFDNITLTKYNEEGSVGPVLEENLFVASDFESGVGNWGGWGGASSRGLSADGEGFGGTGHAFTFTNPTAANSWDAQVAYDFPDALQEGSEYVLNFKVRATTDGSISAGLQNPDGYAGRGAFGSFDITGEWKEITLSTTVTGDNARRFLFDFGHYVGTIYIDDVAIQRLNPDGGAVIEKTPEEKKQIIAEELERWIAGMLEVSKDYVKAWDVLNEPMDDGNPYELKTGVGRDLAADEFYWQDYLGKDYVVEAFRLAREYGNPGDIHFINDYNLEYNLDKCKGIIQLVEYIEDKGETVHGIGTQMHIDINSDKEKIAEMLELLAATGKLIKISELDIGLGGVSTNDATEEQYQAQADMYKYVVEKYFEIIPPSQRYGITIWSPTDSPAGSFWRAGEPIGLWTEGLVRKLAYTGVADGLEEAQ